MLAEAAEQFNLMDETSATLPPLAEALRIQAAEWRRATSHAKKLSKAFGFADDKLDFLNLPRIIAAVRHLAALPRHLAGFRARKLVDEVMGVQLLIGAQLEEAGRKAKALRTIMRTHRSG